MSKRIIIVLVLAAVGIAAALAFRGRKKDDGHIRISGNIELTQVNIAFKISGRLIERAVDEGDTVKKGMVVARLDQDQPLQQRDREQASLAQGAGASGASIHHNRVDSGKPGSRPAAAPRRSEPGAGAATRARSWFPPPGNSRSACGCRSGCRGERTRPKRLERAQVLYKQDDISTSQFDQYRARAESATAALRQAQSGSSWWRRVRGRKRSTPRGRK
jgi:HlyD family secretion protein